jgi:outer membrane receptor protein involved in Fe transport
MQIQYSFRAVLRYSSKKLYHEKSQTGLRPYFSTALTPSMITSRTTVGLAVSFVIAWWTPVAGAVPASASAQADNKELTTLPLEELMQMQVVTAASKFEQLISDAPSSVVVLTASDIRDFGWRTLADALASLPGLYTANDRNYSYLGARGFLRPGDYNSRFLLMIDGVRTNDAVYDQAVIGSEGLLDMDMVKRIEYVPGSGSAVYGSNALFGVINVITRDGSGLPGVQTALSTGSGGERRARASYGWHGQGGADLLLSASDYARDGRDQYFAEFDTPDQNHGVAHRLDYDRAQNLLVKAGYGGFGFEASYVDRTKGVPTGSFGVVFDTPDRTHDTQSAIALSWNGQAARGVALSAQLMMGRADYLGTGYYQQDGGLVLNVDGDHARWYGASLNATIGTLPGQKIVAGLEVGRDARRDQFNYDADPHTDLLDTRSSAARSAVYVEDEIRLPAGFIVNAGLRYDHRDNPDVRRVSPRLAVLRKLSAADTLKLIHGSAFRTPNAYEMYYTLAGSGGQMANPALRPERITTDEAVLEHALGNTGHVTLSLYRYVMRDLINQEVDADTSLLVFRNIDHADARGLETAIEQQFGLARLRASYAWQLARGGDGAPLVDSPHHLAKLNLVTPLPGSDARLGSELLCSSARLGELGTIGGYCMANLTLMLPRVLRDTDFALSMYNATAKRYADVAGPALVQNAVARDGRSLVAKLTTRF